MKYLICYIYLRYQITRGYIVVLIGSDNSR